MKITDSEKYKKYVANANKSVDFAKYKQFAGASKKPSRLKSEKQIQRRVKLLVNTIYEFDKATMPLEHDCPVRLMLEAKVETLEHQLLALLWVLGESIDDYV